MTRQRAIGRCWDCPEMGVWVDGVGFACEAHGAPKPTETPVWATPSPGPYTDLARSGKVAQSSPLRDNEMSDEDKFDALLTDPFTGNLA